MGYFKRVAELTPTRLWINNVTAEQARRGIKAGAVGCTQNPSYVSKMLQFDGSLCQRLFDKWIEIEDDDNEVLIQVQAELVGLIAKEFLPLYEESCGKLGYVTIQGDPFNETTESIMRQAEIARQYGPNIMIKIPVVPEGIKAISALAGEGIPLCLTEVFALRQAIDICEALLDATEGKVKPVAYLAHIAGIYDEYLGNYVKENNIDILPDVYGMPDCISKKVYAVVKEEDTRLSFGWRARGHHFTEMVGTEASVTILELEWAKHWMLPIPLLYNAFMPTPHTVIDQLR